MNLTFKSEQEKAVWLAEFNAIGQMSSWVNPVAVRNLADFAILALREREPQATEGGPAVDRLAEENRKLRAEVDACRPGQQFLFDLREYLDAHGLPYEQLRETIKDLIAEVKAHRST